MLKTFASLATMVVTALSYRCVEQVLAVERYKRYLQVISNRKGKLTMDELKSSVCHKGESLVCWQIPFSIRLIVSRLASGRS
jgi:hypothetical protein